MLLYKNEGRYLYDFYEPQFVKSSNNSSIDLTNTNSPFKSVKG